MRILHIVQGGSERAAALAAATAAAVNLKEAAEHKEIERQKAIEEANFMRKSSSTTTTDYRKKLSACKSIHMGKRKGMPPIYPLLTWPTYSIRLDSILR